jgi:hypothetical protein
VLKVNPMKTLMEIGKHAIELKKVVATLSNEKELVVKNLKRFLPAALLCLIPLLFVASNVLIPTLVVVATGILTGFLDFCGADINTTFSAVVLVLYFTSEYIGTMVMLKSLFLVNLPIIIVAIMPLIMMSVYPSEDRDVFKLNNRRV